MLLAISESVNWLELIAPLGVWNIGRARYYHDDAFQDDVAVTSSPNDDADVLLKSLTASTSETENHTIGEAAGAGIIGFNSSVESESGLVEGAGAARQELRERLPAMNPPDGENLYMTSMMEAIIARVSGANSNPKHLAMLHKVNMASRVRNLSLKFQGSLKPAFVARDEEQQVLWRKIRTAFNPLEEAVANGIYRSGPASRTPVFSVVPSEGIEGSEKSGRVSEPGRSSIRVKAQLRGPSLEASDVAPLLLPLAQMYATRINGEHFEWFFHDIIGRGTGGSGELSYVCGDARNTDMLFAHPLLRTLAEPTYHKVFDELKLQISHNDNQADDSDTDRSITGQQQQLSTTRPRPNIASEFGIMEFLAQSVVAATKEPRSEEDRTVDGFVTDAIDSAHWFRDIMSGSELRFHVCPLIRAYVGILLTIVAAQDHEERCAQRVAASQSEGEGQASLSTSDTSSTSCLLDPLVLREKLYIHLVDGFRSDMAHGLAGFHAWRNSIFMFPPVLYALHRLRHCSSLVPVRIDIDIVEAAPMLRLDFSKPSSSVQGDIPPRSTREERPEGEEDKTSGSHGAVGRFSALMHLAVHPFPERASDLTRRNHAPYCNVEVLRIVLVLALFGLGVAVGQPSMSMEDDAGTHSSLRERISSLPKWHVMDIGANMGDCIVFFLTLFRSWSGTAVEAVGPSAERVRISRKLNGIPKHSLQVKHAAVSSASSKHLVIRAPRSSLQRGTVFCEADPEAVLEGSKTASDGEVWPTVCNSDRERGSQSYADPTMMAPREWAFYAAQTVSLESLLTHEKQEAQAVTAPDLLLINTIGHELQVLQSGGFDGPDDPKLPKRIIFQVYGLGGGSGTGGSSQAKSFRPASASSQLVYRLEDYKPRAIFELLSEKLGYRVYRIVDEDLLPTSSQSHPHDDSGRGEVHHQAPTLLSLFKTSDDFEDYVHGRSNDFDALAVKM